MTELNAVSAKVAAATHGVAPDALNELRLQLIQPSNTKIQIERRARFDAKALKELSATVKEHGVLEPILVRRVEAAAPIEYEIVAGERRWRAAEAAGLKTIPAICRSFTDSEVLGLQLIENIQRETLHALDEAEGFGTLLEQAGYTVERIAAEIAKPRSYVYQRLKLLALCPAARAAFSKGKLVLATAFLLARVPTEDLQKQALKELLECGERGEPMPARAAARHLESRYMLRLAGASFPTEDGELVAAAGPCGTCPKRTGNQPELFKDVQGADVCTDPGCFQTKRAAWTERQLALARSAGRPVIEGAAAKKIAPYGADHLEGHVKPTDRCQEDRKQRTYRQLLGDELKPALLLVPGSGELIEVVDRKSLAPFLKARGVTMPVNKVHDTERARRAKSKQESAFRWALFEAVRKKTPPSLRRKELEQIAFTAFSHHGYESRKRLLKVWGWEPKQGKTMYGLQHEATAEARIPKLTDAELARFLMGLRARR